MSIVTIRTEVFEIVFLKGVYELCAIRPSS